MSSHTPRPFLLLGLCAALFALAACTKKKDDAPAEPVTATAPAEPEVDPRLAPDQGEHGSEHPPVGDAGAGANPHAGAGANPHAGAGANPHAGAGAPRPQMGGGRPPEKTADGRVILGPITAAVPKSWQEKPPKSGMRAAQWNIPGKAGEAELVVYFFGEGGAGGAKANLDRWVGQFEQPDGSPSASKAKIEEKKVAGMPVTFVEVAGRYVAAVMPGATEKHDKADQMMLAAIVETSEGPYYYKLVGPKETVASARKDFRGFIESQKPGDAK